MEGEEFAAEGGRLPDLEELSCDGYCEEGAVRAEAEGGDGGLEGDAVEDDVAVEVDEEGAGGVVDGDEEDAIGGDCDAGDVGGGLAG